MKFHLWIAKPRVEYSNRPLWELSEALLSIWSGRLKTFICGFAIHPGQDLPKAGVLSEAVGRGRVYFTTVGKIITVTVNLKWSIGVNLFHCAKLSAKQNMKFLQQLLFCLYIICSRDYNKGHEFLLCAMFSFVWVKSSRNKSWRKAGCDLTRRKTSWIIEHFRAKRSTKWRYQTVTTSFRAHVICIAKWKKKIRPLRFLNQNRKAFLF